MGCIQTAWAWAQQGLSPDEKLLLLALAEDSNHANRCWPKKAVLVERTGLPEDIIIRSLQTLRGFGLIDTVETPGQAHEHFLRLEKLTVRKAARSAVAPISVAPSQAAVMQEVVDRWNAMAKRTALGNRDHRIPAVRKLTDKMKVALKARLDGVSMLDIERCILDIEGNAHTRGVNDRNWVADFNYLMSPSGFANTLNGRWSARNYEEASNGGTRTAPGGRGDQRLDNLRSFDAAVRGRGAPGRGRSGRDEEDRGQPALPGRGPGEDGPHLPVGGPDSAG